MASVFTHIKWRLPIHMKLKEICTNKGTEMVYYNSSICWTTQTRFKKLTRFKTRTRNEKMQNGNKNKQIKVPSKPNLNSTPIRY